MDESGSLVVRLDKVLYGCVESAALWHEHLSQTLTRMDYVRNAYDSCVYNSTVRGIQCTVAVQNEDPLIICVDRELKEEFIQGMKAIYGEVKRSAGAVGYLGMMLDLSVAGEARITTGRYVDDMLKTHPVGKEARTPALDDLLSVNDDDTVCGDEIRR